MTRASDLARHQVAFKTALIEFTDGDDAITIADGGGITANTSLTLASGSTVTSIKDEDDFTSDSDTALATQQSIKAYVTTVAGQANNVTGLNATGAELNAVADFSAVSVDTSTAIANNDAILMFDNGNEIGYRDVDLLDDYFAGTTKTLTNKTLTSPTVTGLHLNDSGFTVEGSSEDGNETTVSFTNPTADRTITMPNETGIVLLKDSATGSVQLPAGTTAQRSGSPANGMIRYNTDDDALEVYKGGAWGLVGRNRQTASTSSTSQTAIATYTASSSLGIEITVIATDTVATERTITKLLVTHDGSTAVATQYGEINTATAMASYDVDINSGNVRLLATAASSNATNFTVNAVVLD